MCVARIDIAGGWTDTPPQAYEWGGVVVTLAIKINNEVISTCITLKCACVLRSHSTPQNPIQCTATRIER